MKPIYMASHRKGFAMKTKALSIAIVSAIMLGVGWYSFATAATPAPKPTTIETISSCMPAPCKSPVAPTSTSTTAKPELIPARTITRTTPAPKKATTTTQPTTTTSEVPPKLTAEQEAKIQAGIDESKYEYCQANGYPNGCNYPEYEDMADSETATDW